MRGSRGALGIESIGGVAQDLARGDLRSGRANPATSLRSLALRIAALDEEIGRLDRALEELVRRTAPRTTALLGVGIQHAGQLLVTARQNVGRLRNEAAFAHLCAADPIPASRD